MLNRIVSYPPPSVLSSRTRSGIHPLQRGLRRTRSWIADQVRNDTGYSILSSRTGSGIHPLQRGLRRTRSWIADQVRNDTGHSILSSRTGSGIQPLRRGLHGTESWMADRVHNDTAQADTSAESPRKRQIARLCIKSASGACLAGIYSYKKNSKRACDLLKAARA